MKKISIRQFSLKYDSLEYPIVLTHYNVPKFVVYKYGDLKGKFLLDSKNINNLKQ